MSEEKRVTIGDLGYPACIDEIIKYMDYLPGTDDEKRAYINMYVYRVVSA